MSWLMEHRGPVRRPSAVRAAVRAAVLATLSTALPALAAPPIAWTTAYNDPANFDDEGSAVAMDALCNVYAGGYETRTDLGESFNWLLRKYDAAGALVWTRTHNAPANFGEDLKGLAVDSAGNVIAVGSEDRTDLGEGQNWFVVKYDPAGAMLWTRTYNSPANATDVARAVTVDSSGNVIVVGTEDRSDLVQSWNWRIFKFDANGNDLWTDAFSGAANRTDTPWTVATDAADNVYVGGDAGVTATDSNWVLRQYTAGGVLQWTRTFGGVTGGSSFDTLRRVAVNSAGTVLAAGEEWPNGSTAPDWRLIAYDGSGSVLWSTAYGQSDLTKLDRVRGAAADPTTGHFIVGGPQARDDLGQGQNWLVRRYDASGNLVWTTGYNNPSNSSDILNDVEVNAQGRIAVIGTEFRTDLGQGANWRVVTFSDSGTGSCPGVIPPPPPLNVSVLFNPATGTPGAWQAAVVAVENPGTNAANGVSTDLHATAGGGLIANLTAPAGTQTVSAGGGTAFFTWTFTPSGTGAITFAATATGTEDVTGDAMFGTVVGAGFTVPATSATVLVTAGVPAALTLGQTVEISVTVWNIGGSSAVSVSAYAPSQYAGAGAVTMVGGPVPDLATIPPGGASLFVFSVSATGAGAVSWTFTASGTDALSGNPILAATNATLTVQLPPSFGGSRPAPLVGTVREGALFSASLFIENSGEAPLVVTAVALGTFGSAPVTLMSAPTPSLPLVLAGGTGTQYVWMWRAEGPGLVSFSTTLTAHDGNVGPGDPFTFEAVGAASVTVTGSARLAATLWLSSYAPAAGETITARLTLSNTGSVDVVNVSASLFSLNPAKSVVTGGPAPQGAITVLAMGTTTFAWSVRADAAGAVVLAATVFGEDGGDGFDLAAAGSSVLVIAAAPTSPPAPSGPDEIAVGTVKIVGGIRGYLNPKRGELSNILLRPRDSGPITVRIWNSAGTLVRTLSETAVAGRTVTIQWDGRNTAGSEVAPGLYPVLIEGPGIRHLDKLAVLR